MRLAAIACHGIDDLFFRIDDYIHNKIQPHGTGGKNHIPMDRVPLQNTGAGARIRNKLRAMVRQNRLSPRNSGQHALSPAGKACKEVRLYKPFRAQKIRLNSQAVQHKLTAGRQPAQRN